MLRQRARGFVAVSIVVVLGCVLPQSTASSSAPEDAAPTPPKTPVPEAAQVAPPVARLDSAEIYYAWGDYAAVVRVLSRQANGRPRANLLLGWSLYQLGRMPEAVTVFERGLELAPENLDLINGHAFALYRTDQPERAEAEFRRILATNPEREESIRGLIKDFKLNPDGKGGKFVHPRDGSIDWPVVRRALSDVGYDGWATIEDGGLEFTEFARRFDLIAEGK